MTYLARLLLLLLAPIALGQDAPYETVVQAGPFILRPVIAFSEARNAGQWIKSFDSDSGIIGDHHTGLALIEGKRVAATFGFPRKDPLSLATSAFFLDRKKGWILVDDEVFGTTDSGRTWTRLATIPSQNELTGIRAVHVSEDFRRVWIGGTKIPPRPDLDGELVLLESRDGGLSWKEHPLPIYPPKHRMASRQVLQILRVGERTVVLLDRDVLYSDDDGVTWRLSDFPARCNAPDFLIERDETAQGIEFLNKDQGWLGFDDWYLFRTVDGGQTFCKVNEPDQAKGPLRQFHFANSNLGIALHDLGDVMYTEDGGRNWAVVRTKQRFLAISSASPTVGWLLGNTHVYSFELRNGASLARRRVTRPTP